MYPVYMCVCVSVLKRYQWFSGVSLQSSSLLSLSPLLPPIASLPLCPFNLPPSCPHSLFLDLEDEQAQVDVFGGQQFVALHRIGDGQRDVFCLVGVIAEGVMVDDWLNANVVVRPLQQQEGALECRVHLWTDTCCIAEMCCCQSWITFDSTLMDESESSCDLSNQFDLTQIGLIETSSALKTSSHERTRLANMDR